MGLGWRRHVLIGLFSAPIVIAVIALLPARAPAVTFIDGHSTPLRSPGNGHATLAGATGGGASAADVQPGDPQFVGFSEVQASGHQPVEVVRATALTSSNIRHARVLMGIGGTFGAGSAGDGFATVGSVRPRPASGVTISPGQRWMVYAVGELGPNDPSGALLGVRLTVRDADGLHQMDLDTRENLCRQRTTFVTTGLVTILDPCARYTKAFDRDARRFFADDFS